MWRVALVVALLACCAAPATSSTGHRAIPSVLFEYTGSAQTWTVPDGVTSATFYVYGGGGGAGGNNGGVVNNSGSGGHGAGVQATLPVEPGQQITIDVGGRGKNATLDPGAGGYPMGAPGAKGVDSEFGGQSTAAGGGGGGDSSVWFGITRAAQVVVAGGGGGGGGGGTTPGGKGGDSGAAGGGPQGGGGGTASSGGAGGGDAQAGKRFRGGAAGTIGGGGGGAGDWGGGGGGWSGGPGDSASGGGGGSSYVDPAATGVQIQPSNNAGDGEVGISYEGQPEETATPTATAAAPGTLSPPTISGDPRVGKTLTCDPGTYSGAPSTFTYAWLRDAAPISGATAATYTVVAADAGHRLQCRVTATNASGAVVATSAFVQVADAVSAGDLKQFLKDAPLNAGVLQGKQQLSFTAPEAGRLLVSAFSGGASGARAAKRVLLAKGRHAFAAAGKGKLKLALTAKGRKAIKKHDRLRVAFVARFTPTGGKRVSATRDVSLRVRAA
jgi:hypothetical protein